MLNLFNYIDDYLKGKSIFSPASKFLSFCFSVSISSFIFKKYYFNYKLLDFTDYKGLYDFFVTGSFIIPLILFTVIHYGISIIANGIFSLSAEHKSSKWKTWILKQKIDKGDYRRFYKTINQNPLIPFPVKMDKGVIIKYYEAVKKSISSEQWEMARVQAKNKKREIVENFILAFKGIIALTVYFINIAYFGILLYVLIIVVLIASLIFFFFAFLTLDVAPLLIQKVDLEFMKVIDAENAKTDSE